MATYYVANMPVSDELYHFGILGMKWGIRRYQNPDGSLTDEGRKRYGSPEAHEKYNQHIKTSGDTSGTQYKLAKNMLKQSHDEYMKASKKYDEALLGDIRKVIEVNEQHYGHQLSDWQVGLIAQLQASAMKGNHKDEYENLTKSIKNYHDDLSKVTKTFLGKYGDLQFVTIDNGKKMSLSTEEGYKFANRFVNELIGERRWQMSRLIGQGDAMSNLPYTAKATALQTLLSYL